MPELNFSGAEKERIKLTAEQQKQIEALYKQASKDIAKRAEKAPRVPSDALRKQYLLKLQKQIDEELESIQKEIQNTIEDNMDSAAGAVVQSNLDFLSSLGMPIEGAFSHIPGEAVKAVITGQLYEDNWALSKALWKHTKKAQQDINSIIAKGIAENKSSYDIAKDLEKYVNPSARKDWDWSKVYPGTNKKVDYNAQRLARTMVSHAYQYSFVQTTKHNPFVEDYIWRSAGSERTCEICAERNGKHYAKDKLPLDHPNGLCTFIANIPDNMEDIADRLADWAHGKSDPELDEFVKSLYGDKWNKPTEPKEMEYRYHATRRSSIVSIIEKGLSPSKGHIGKGVYFAQSIEDALEWTAETSTGGTTVLRVSLDFLLSKGYEEYDADETVYNRAEGLVDHKISFDNIEIKMGDEWMTLTTFAETYRNSVYKNLSSTAQKKVDKQWSKETQEWIKKGVK